jgi:hypothetical protein
MATILGNGTVTYGDSSVQSKAVGTGGGVVFQSPGTLAIPSTTTRIKVTCIGGGGGVTPAAQAESALAAGGAGASGGASSFGSYLTATGGTTSSRGSTQGATYSLFDSMGSFGIGAAPVERNPGAGYGGHGVKYIDAPFPQTQVSVIVGAGGGGGGASSLPSVNGTAAQQINGGRGGPAVVIQAPLGNWYANAAGGGGASGTSSPYQGTGGLAGVAGGPAPTNLAQAGQPGANPYAGIYGGLGGNNANNPYIPGGAAGYQGIVIVEYF